MPTVIDTACLVTCGKSRPNQTKEKQVKLTLNVCNSMSDILTQMNVCEKSLTLAVNASLGELGDATDTTTERQMKMKSGKKVADTFVIKGKDGGKWSGTLNAPLRFFALNGILRELEEVGMSIPALTFPPCLQAWMEKFIFTQEQVAARAARNALIEKANQASYAAREAILKGNQT